jgi:hypothetical protein
MEEENILCVLGAMQNKDRTISRKDAKGAKTREPIKTLGAL